MEKLLKLLPHAMLLILVNLVCVPADAQKQLAPVTATDFNFTYGNDVQVDSKTLEFDLFLKDTDPATPFYCSIVQVGMYISKNCLNGGTPVISMVAGSSEMIPAMVPSSFQYATYNSSQSIIKVAPLALPGCSGGAGGTVLSISNPGTRYCRLRISNTVDFLVGSQANLVFSLTTLPYKTSVYSYNSSCTSNSITTTTGNCFALGYNNVILNGPPAVFNVTGGGAYCEGTIPSGMPVGLSGSDAGITYTLYQDGSALTPTYSGTGVALAFGNQSGTHT